MRIWDVPPEKLCRKHLLGEHRELHAVWAILTEGKKGYAHHPETLRWKGKLKALYLRHGKLVKELVRRGYNHQSPLPSQLAKGNARQNVYLNTPEEQVLILRERKCGCKV